MGSRKRKILLLFVDLLSLYLSLFLTLWIRFSRDFNQQIILFHIIPFSMLYPIWLIIIYSSGFYEISPFHPSPISFGISFFLIFLISSFAFYFFPFFKISPKTNLFLHTLIFFIFLFASRTLFRKIWRAHFITNILVLEEGEEAKEVLERLRSNPLLGFRTIEKDQNWWEQINGLPIELIVGGGKKEEKILISELEKILNYKISLLDFYSFYEFIMEKMPPSCVGTLWFLRTIREREKILFDRVKRIIDLFSSIIIILLTSFLWPLIAIAIKLEDRGPIFYTQKRVGKNKKIFSLIKFRTMIIGAQDTEPKWVTEDDKRITRVGKILRKLYLDEIPQAINILRGDISLIGPRPQRKEIVEMLENENPYYQIRHIVKPGLTGWAQIKYKSPSSIEEFFEQFQYDLYYIKNRSFFLDLKIILKSLQIFLKMKQK